MTSLTCRCATGAIARAPVAPRHIEVTTRSVDHRFLHIGGHSHSAALLERGSANVEVVLCEVWSDRGVDDGVHRRRLDRRLCRRRDVDRGEEDQCDSEEGFVLHQCGVVRRDVTQFIGEGSFQVGAAVQASNRVQPQ